MVGHHHVSERGIQDAVARRRRQCVGLRGLGPQAKTAQRDGKRYEYNGETTIPSGAEIRVATAKDKLSLSLREMDKGSWVIFELPGFTSTVGGTQQASLDALRAANTTSFFKDDKALWVKLVVEDPVPKGPIVVQVGQLRAQANIAVSKQTSVATASLDEAGSRRQ